MFQIFRKELMWGGRQLVLETGKLARQADGAVLATYGETTVLCTAVAMKNAKPAQTMIEVKISRFRTQNFVNTSRRLTRSSSRPRPYALPPPEGLSKVSR